MWSIKVYLTFPEASVVVIVIVVVEVVLVVNVTVVADSIISIAVVKKCSSESPEG